MISWYSPRLFVYHILVNPIWPGVPKVPELEFLNSLWGLGTEEEERYRTGPPGYIGWRNSFLGIDSGAPYTFKNTGSGQDSNLRPKHGSNIYKESKPWMSAFLKNLPVKVLGGRCLSNAPDPLPPPLQPVLWIHTPGPVLIRGLGEPVRRLEGR